jgi:hypothetical protein
LRTVIVFVIVTAVLNIGLGYALAIYLGPARGFKSQRSSLADEIPAEAPFMAPALPAAPALTISSSAPAAPPAADPLEAEADETELEQDVLAGIEEFRNQLAKMKALPEEESAIVADER